MQIVEYLEEGILRAGFVGELLHVVYYQHVHGLIVMQEVGYGILDDRVHIVGLEMVGRNVEHNLVGEPFLDVDTYRLGQVSLAETGAAVNKKGLYAVLPGFSEMAMPAARPRRLQSPSIRLSKE